MSLYKVQRIFKSIVATPINILESISSIGDFIIAVIEYLIYKADLLIRFVNYIISSNINLVSSAKFKLTSKLIWSQGKLGYRIRYMFIFLLAWAVFMLGTVFQGSVIEVKEEDRFVFLNSDSVLATTASAATEEGIIKLPDEPIEHVVAEGESLTIIGKKYGISVESIKFANNLVSNEVKAGKILQIPPVDGTLHQVKKGDTIDSLAKRYKVPSQTIVDFNYLDSPYTLIPGDTLTIPDANIPTTERYYAGTPVYDMSAYGIIPTQSFANSGSGNFIWPMSGILTQFFSAYHPGLDIANKGVDIVAADKGRVVRAGWWQGGYGNAVQIDHGNGFVTTYAHMSSIAVSVGDDVDKGKKLGVVGSTGRSTGPHLHFTVQEKGKYVNPLSVLPR